MGGIRRILPPTYGETATFQAKWIGRLLWNDFYSRNAAVADGHEYPYMDAPGLPSSQFMMTRR